MKFFSILAAAAAVASAAAVAKREVETLFNVTDFTAGCIPHSSACRYSFNVTQPGAYGSAVKCEAQVPGNPSGKLPIILNGTCIESARTWQAVWTPNGDLSFSVYQYVSRITVQEGLVVLSGDDFYFDNYTTGIAQTYNGYSTLSLAPVYVTGQNNDG